MAHAHRWCGIDRSATFVALPAIMKGLRRLGLTLTRLARFA